MLIYFKDETSVEIGVAPDLLWDIYQQCLAEHIEVKLLVEHGGKSKKIDILAALDPDRTFGEVIQANFPTIPPDIPGGPDTESTPGLLGAESGWEQGDSGHPVATTMPCRER